MRDSSISRESVDDVLRRALESASFIPFLVFDASSTSAPVTYVSAAFAELTGYRRDELLGSNAKSLPGDLLAAASYEEVEHAVAAGESCVVQIECQRKDGSSRATEDVRFAPLLDRQNNSTHYLRLHTVQEPVQLTEALESARSTFQIQGPETQARGDTRTLARLSHEMRTPLNAVIGFSELAMQQGTNHPDQTKYLGHVLDAGRQLLALVDSFTASAGEGGRSSQASHQFGRTNLGASALAPLEHPVSAQNEADKSEREDLAVRSQSSMTPAIRILYVEDNLVNSVLFDAVLGARTDVQLRIAEPGSEALDLVRSWIPDVLVLDANLPDIHGIQLLKQLREVECLTSTPAFMCSANALAEDVQQALDAGFRSYWTKPVNFSIVMSDLRQLHRLAN